MNANRQQPNAKRQGNKLSIQSGLKIGLALLLASSMSQLPAALAQKWEDPSGNRSRIAYQFYMEGMRLEQAGDLHNAVVAYRKSISQLPNVKEVHHQLAKLLARTGQNEQAMSEFRSALNIDYNYVECRNNYGMYLKRNDKREDAESQFKQCIQIDAKFPYAYYNLGNMLKDKGDLTAAIDNFEHATHLKPDFAEAQEALGMAIFERASQGDLSVAAEKLQLAAKLVPKNPKIHYHLGTIYATKSDLDGAETEFRTALMCDPRFSAAHWELAKLRYYRGDLDRCLGELKQAQAISATYTASQNYPQLDVLKVTNLEAHTYEYLGELEKAIADYQKLMAMRKSDPVFQEKVKTLTKEIKREMADRRKHPLPYDPQEVDAFITKGINAYEDGDLQTARTAFERGSELNPTSFRCKQNLCFIQEAEGDLNGAIATAQAAMQLNPEYDGTIYNLAYLLEKANLADDAARMYAKFREKANTYPYDPQHIIDLQQNIIREMKKDQALRKRGY